MDRCVYEFDPAEVGSTWGIDEPWSCPHEAHPEADRCPFHLSPDRRSELGVDAATVRDRLLSVVDAEDASHKRLVGADLPTLSLDYRTVEGRTRQPLDLRHADVDGLAFDHATVDQPIDLRGATVGGLSMDNAELETAVRADGATITGEVDTFESVFRGDVDFPEAEFRDRVSFAESRFREEVTFDRVRFRARASFEGARFHGRSNRRDDNASFVETRFATVSFDQADFEFAAFEGATFGERAGFQECTFDGELVFDDAVFEGVADFNEARFLEDSLFRRTEYRGEAHFRGVEFEGGANLLDDDADFEEAVFHEDALFDHAEFVHADFRDAAFEGRADFEEARFEDDADLSGVTVAGTAAFQEAVFVDAVDLTDAAFEAVATFENAEFGGDSNDRDDNADLSGARFAGEAEFEQSTFVSARFRETRFEARAGFEEVTFEGQVSLDDAVFEGVADFDEARFLEDALFRRTEYHGEAHFRGVEFEGGANLLDDDADFEEAVFHEDALFDHGEFVHADFHDAEFVGRMDFEESTFEDDADFSGVVAEGLAAFQEAVFVDAVDFTDAAFEAGAEFENAEFGGDSNDRDDNADLSGATFGDEADFEQSTFVAARLAGTRFEGRAGFEDCVFDREVAFDDAVFEGHADFDETRFREDALFRRTEYRDEAHFRGVEFEGGANLLDDDADFEAARFRGPATFEQGEFAYADFHEVAFEDDAVFERATFEEDADFHDTTFGGLADFDEARFYGDGDFSNTVYRGRADFRGVEFIGEERHLQDSARFRGSTFEGAVEFDSAVFTTADFREVRLAESADFQDVEFRDRLAFAVGSVATTGSGRTASVDMTGAHLADGTITQPDDHWVRYDMTRATIGPVELAGEGAAETDEQLFDYFRFVETDFDGFDFSAHRTYLERDDWQLHVFEGDDRDGEFAVAATPEAVETTYLYAYNNARAMGDGDAAIEFAIYQAKFRRRKNVGYVRDPNLPTRYRARKVGDVVGNFLWYQSCGYGYRLWRIVAVSVGVIVLWAVLYAMPFTRLDNQESLSSVGALFSAEGVETAGTYLYYSLVTFTTVGYGDINPVNASARFLAVSEGVLGVLLAALVVFVLGRRVAL